MLTLPALPKPLTFLVSRLPGFPVSMAFVTMFNRLAWRGLCDLDWASLRGKRFCVQVSNLGTRSYFSVTARGLRPEMADHADVIFTATSDDFIRLALRLEDPDTLFFNRRLLIEGNTDLGLTVKNMLDSVELEALLAAMPVPLAHLMTGLRNRMADAETAIGLTA